MKWQHPFTSIIAGPTGCGKSVFVSKFLKHIKEMIDVDIREIIWCYGESQPLHAELQEMVSIPIKFNEGLPDLNDIAPDTQARLLIIDDLMRESNGSVVDIFSKGSHHRNISIIFITQNIFYQGKGSRDMSLNAHYSVYPENPKFIHDSFLDATSSAHSYLLFDMKQSTPDAFRFRTAIFPGESNWVYVPKQSGKNISQFFAV
ncbi:hypothetical protein B566_EDAN018052 [Ephemera danica]|nr:hypothetical protein B566_EDAN018052 [Ephemera danica]